MSPAHKILLASIGGIILLCAALYGIYQVLPPSEPDIAIPRMLPEQQDGEYLESLSGDDSQKWLTVYATILHLAEQPRSEKTDKQIQFMLRVFSHKQNRDKAMVDDTVIEIIQDLHARSPRPLSEKEQQLQEERLGKLYANHIARTQQMLEAFAQGKNIGPVAMGRHSQHMRSEKHNIDPLRQLERSMQMLQSSFDRAQHTRYPRIELSKLSEQVAAKEQQIGDFSIALRLQVMNRITKNLSQQNVARIGDEVADLLVLLAADDVELVKKAYASLLSFMAKYDGYESEFRSPLQLLAYHHPYLMEDMLRRAQTPPTFEPNIRKFLETVDDPEVTQTLVSLLGKELDKKHFGYELHLLTKAYFQGKISFEQLDAELAKHPNPNTDFTRKIIAAHQQQHYEQMADLLHKHIKPFGAPWMEYPEYQAAKNLLASVTLYTPVALEKLLPTYAKWTGGTNDLEISKNMKTFIALNPNRAAEAIPILNLLLHKGLHHSPNSYRPIFDAIAQAGEENVDMIIEQMAQNILHSDIHDAAISYGLMLRYGHRYNIAPTTLVLQARKTGRATIWERIKQMHLLAEANNPQALLRALPGIAYDDIVYEALRRMFRDDFRPSEHDIAALLEYYRSLDWDTPNQDKHKYTILNSLSENEFLSRQIILEQLLPHYYADLDKPITPSTRESLHNTLARLIKNNPDISRQFAQSLIKKIPANIENPNYKSLPRAVIRPLLAQWRNAMLIAPLTLIYAQNTDEKEALFYLASSLLYSPELQAHLMAQREALANPQTPRETDLKAIYDDMYAVWYYAQNGFQSEMVIKHMKSLFYYVPKDKSLSWASKTIAANMLLPLRDLRPPFVIKLFQSMLDDFAARNYQAYYSLHELRIVLPQAVWPYFHKYPSAIKYFGNDVPYQRILLDDDPAAMLVMLEESINFLNNQGITLERVVESPNYDLKFRKENSALWNKLIGVANYANSQNAYGGAKILDRPGRMLNERSEFGKKFMRAITLNHCARDPEKLRKQLKELTTDPNIKVAEFAKEILPLCVKDASS